MTTPAGIYNALDFGVVGDGTTDDGPAIQSMVDACIEGSRFYFPPGTYAIETEVVIGQDGVHLIGASGAANPINGGQTYFLRTTAGRITFDKDPGGTTPDAPDPDGVVNGGGATSIYFSGNSGVATVGIRIVKARNLVFRDCTLQGFVTGIQTTNNGSTAGDTYDQNTQLLFDHCEVIGTTGTGISIDNAYNCSFRNVAVAMTSSGVGIDIHGVDDLWFTGCTVLTQSASGTNLRLNGADYGDTAAVYVHWIGGYLNGVGTKIESVADGFDIVPTMQWHGLANIDGEPEMDLDAGTRVSYYDNEGRHNMRLHLKTSAELTEDFWGGSATTTDIGEQGWSLATSGSGLMARIDSSADHPGVHRLNTGSTSGSESCVYLPNSTTEGILVPSETFESEFIFRANAVDSATLVRVGFGMAPNANPPTDGIYLEKLAADTQWFGVCRSGGSQTRSSAISTATTGWTHLRIKRVNSTTIGFQLGESVNHNDDKRITADIPTAVLSPLFYIKTSAASSKTMDVDAFQVQLFNLAR